MKEEMRVEALSSPERALKADAARTAGGQTALADLYDRHAEALYRLLAAMLGSSADAQDALSEVLLEAARRDLRGVRNLRAYLLASARNKAISMIRRRKREVTMDPANECFFNTAGLSPEQAFLAQRIEAALQDLPAEQREVVVLKVYEGLTFAEIAKITRKRPNTVASRYRYAVEKLQRRLKEE
jgi:RNA polymerase sigma-70 factor (ECF subfamily)